MAQGPSFQSVICTDVMKLPRVAAFPLIMEVAERDSRTTSSENHPPSLTVTSADTGPSQQCFTYSCWLPGTTCVVSDCRIEEEIFLSQRHGHTGPQTERCSVKHMVFWDYTKFWSMHWHSITTMCCKMPRWQIWMNYLNEKGPYAVDQICASDNTFQLTAYCFISVKCICDIINPKKPTVSYLLLNYRHDKKKKKTLAHAFCRLINNLCFFSK